MGYTTQFTGTIELSEPISLKTAKEWLLIAETEKPAINAPSDGYLQWVPTEDLKGIVWDGNEKFYDYIAWMEWVIDTFIKPNGIEANGQLLWSGEEVGDSGVLTVVRNVVSAIRNNAASNKSRRPLRLRTLSDMLLEKI